jgi:hypothetical protein
MTRTELLTIRDQTYRPPPERRCETCRHGCSTNYWTFCSLASGRRV